MSEASGGGDLSAPQETQNLLYEESGRIAATFWEWRHKVILLLSAVLTTALAIAAWMYEQKLGGAIAIPFAFAAIMANACRIFDRRNAEILEGCFTVAIEVEGEWKASKHVPAGIYSRILSSRSRGRTYTQILHWGYTAIALGLTICAFGFALTGIFEPHLLYPPQAPTQSNDCGQWASPRWGSCSRPASFE